MNFNFLRTNICLVAFWHILFICSAHLPLLDMVTPKCLWLSTWFKLSELNFRFIGFMFCRNEIIYSVFWGLKSTSHCFAQLSKTWRSKFNLSSTSNGLVDENIKELSSANNLTRLWISSAISFIKKKNSNGPRTDPCETPAFNVPSEEIELFNKTCCFLSEI